MRFHRHIEFSFHRLLRYEQDVRTSQCENAENLLVTLRRRIKCSTAQEVDSRGMSLCDVVCEQLSRSWAEQENNSIIVRIPFEKQKVKIFVEIPTFTKSSRKENTMWENSKNPSCFSDTVCKVFKVNAETNCWNRVSFCTKYKIATNWLSSSEILKVDQNYDEGFLQLIKEVNFIISSSLRCR